MPYMKKQALRIMENPRIKLAIGKKIAATIWIHTPYGEYFPLSTRHGIITLSNQMKRGERGGGGMRENIEKLNDVFLRATHK